jgi:hypothetical protein
VQRYEKYTENEKLETKSGAFSMKIPTFVENLSKIDRDG